MSAVRPCVADTYLVARDEVVDRVRDCIEGKGDTPAEIARNLSSTRREFVKRFMAGREEISLKRAISMAEVVGLKVRVVVETDESIAPRRRADAPRDTYERGLSVADAGRPIPGTVPSGSETSHPCPVA